MRKLVFTGLVMMFIISSCAEKQIVVEEPSTDSPCPEWYNTIPQEPEFIFAAATAVSRDLQTAVDKAKIDARAEIAREMQVHMKGLADKFVEEVGLAPESNMYSKFTNVSKSVIDQTLVGSKVRHQSTNREGEGWRACVLMECSQAEAEGSLVDKISRDQEMYTRFRASQAFQEMENQIKELREYKKEQGLP